MSYIGNPIVTQAFVTDQFNGNGSTTAFTMSVAPANTASILVAVSGVVQDPTTYSVNGLTLTFSAAPPTGTGNISVRYLGIPASGVTTTAYRTVTEFTATAGQTTFTPPSYTVGFINVYRNGVRLGAADYTATNGTTVVLASGATASDLVTVESYYVSSVLNAIPNTPNSIVWNNLPTGSLLQVVSTTVTDSFSTSSTSYVDRGLSATITPKNSTSKILCLLNIEPYNVGASNASGGAFANIVRGSTQIVENAVSAVGLGKVTQLSISYLDSPATTSSTTYKIQVKTEANGVFGSLSGYAQTITLMEIAG